MTNKIYLRATVKKIRQQPTFLANIGRFNTVVRFLVEKCISHFKNRYDICKFIPWWVVDCSGIMLRFISAVHCHFEIGKIKYVLFTHN